MVNLQFLSHIPAKRTTNWQFSQSYLSVIHAFRSSQRDPSQQQTCPGDPLEHHTSHQSHCCSHTENHASVSFPYSPNLLHSAKCSFINKEVWSLNTFTAMSTAVLKHVTAGSKCGNTVPILLRPSMATVMGASLHRKLTCAENSGSNFNPQFNKCSNS